MWKGGGGGRRGSQFGWEGFVVSLPGVPRLTRSGQGRRQLVTFPGAKGQVGQER